MSPLRFLTVIVVLLIASACSGGGGSAPNPVLAGTGDVAAGEELFAANCALCHGVDADGTA